MPTPTALASTPVPTVAVKPSVTPTAALLPPPKGGMSTNRKIITQCQNKTDEVTITIDDGISSQEKLDQILSTLKKNNVRAYFFLLGDFAKKHPKMMKQVEAAGHVLGNHSFNHPSFTRLKDKQVVSQIKRGVEGNTKVKLLRPPYGNGAFDKRVQKLARLLGYGMCYWTVDTQDWSSAATKSKADIIRRVRNGDKYTPPVSKGGVILLHGTTKYGAASLQGIIDVVHKKGLKLQRLHE